MKRPAFVYLSRLVMILAASNIFADIGRAVERPAPKKNLTSGTARNPARPAQNFQIATTRPDLRVTAFAVVQPKYVGTKLVVSFTMVVQNTGNKTTGTHFFNAIYLGDKVVWSGKSDALIPNASHRINGDVSISDPAKSYAGKSFKLVAKADARLIAGDTSVPQWAFVEESNEQNNTFQSVTLTVPGSLGLTSRVATPLTPTRAATPTRAQSKPTPTRASAATPTRAVQYRPETLWTNREIPTAGNAPLQLLSLDGVVKDFMKNEGVTGMTVAISKDERLVYSRAFGYANLDKNIEMSHTHRALIGSVSKIITTLAVMKLTELQDDFSLDRPVYGYDKSLKTPFDPPNPLGFAANGILTDPAYLQAICTGTQNINQARDYASMRVGHLLTHSSGLYKVNAPEEGLPIRDAHLGVLRLNKLAYKPGTGTEYQNHSMGTSGLIIETASGMGYEKFCRKWILDRASLPHIVPHGVNKSSRDAAQHELKNGSFVAVEVESRSAADEAGGTPAGGWSSSAIDLVKLMCATDRSSTRPDVLHRDTLATMESIPFPSAQRFDVTVGTKKVGDEDPRAHGWAKTSKGELSHGGAIEDRGASAYILKIPANTDSANETGFNLALVFTCYVDSAKRVELLSDLANAVSKAYLPASLDLF